MSNASGPEGVLIPGTDGSAWYVFHTRPRREKKGAEVFADLGLRHYLPLREQVTRRGRRTFRSRVPLFTGYVFACCDIGKRLWAMQSGHFSRWLEVKDQLRLLAELQGIRIAVERGTGVELYPRLRRGQWVRVVSGALRGVHGRISRRKEKYRIVLELTALQAAMAVEVDMKDVELAAGPDDWEETRSWGDGDVEHDRVDVAG